MKAAGGRFLTKSKPRVVFPSPAAAAAPSPCTEEPGVRMHRQRRLSRTLRHPWDELGCLRSPEPGCGSLRRRCCPVPAGSAPSCT
ncbi:hypothetical protein Anapl_07835 [Anas platyrhynchos]|uniref:Uncharacterized protein n=1 Tax=Anas platyrhynchos TaxID=8839 RepID=R0JW67_ANAPL|nr:hypothetical protein Anapl_07835 [Anas platyrhynchos]